jgi:hypothetical protein
MLPLPDYIDKFRRVQRATESATNHVARLLRPGVSEKEIADLLAANLRGEGLFEHWYPLLVCAGDHTGKPLSREEHLPSAEVRVRGDDVVVLDANPLVGTVWSNFCVSVAVGEDEFFHQLCADGEQLVIDALRFAESGSATTFGDLINYSEWRIQQMGLELISERGEYGHVMEQMKAGQTSDATPEIERVFLNREFGDRKLEGIISIEPHIGRKHPQTGTMYGCKQHRMLLRLSN